MINLMAVPERTILRITRLFRNTLSAERYGVQERWLEAAASVAAPVVAVLGLVLAIIAAVKLDSFAAFLAGIAWVILICIGYFIGRQFLISCQRLITNNPSMVSSAAILECAGLIGILALAGLLSGAIFSSIRLSSLAPLASGLAGALAVLYCVAFALNPRIISTTVNPAATAGEDALALLVIFYKCLVRLASVVFSSSLLIGAALILRSVVLLLGDDLSEVLGGGVSSFKGVSLVIGGLIYPVVISLSFSFFYLFADLCQAILSLHRRPPSELPTSEPAVAHPAPSSEPASDGAGTSVILVVLVALVVTVGLVVKGRQMWSEHQQAAQLRQQQAEQDLAQQQALAAEQQAAAESAATEAAQRAAYLDAARQHLGQSALDFILDDQVNQHLQQLIAAEELAEFERLFSHASLVVEQSGVLLAAGCDADPCGSRRALVAVETKGAKTYALASVNGRVTYFGLADDQVASLPAPIKKWVLSVVN